MRALFSLKLWLILLDRLIGALFPVVCILLIFSCFNKTIFKKNSPFRLLLIAVLLDFFLRALLFFSGVRYSDRYFLVLTVMAIVPAVPGVLKLIELFQKFAGRYYPAITLRFSTVLIFSVISIACVGKALNPRFDKKWIKEISVVIKTSCPEAQKPVLITDLADRRIAYYAKAEYLKFCTETDKIFTYAENKSLEIRAESGIIIATPGKGRLCGAFISLNMPAGIADFADNIHQLGGERVFVLMCRKDSDFRELFRAKGLIFPLKLIREFHDDKKRPLCLYQGYN